MTFIEALEAELSIIKNMLEQKNRMYGNSVFSPIRVFSKSSVDNAIDVRIDDKLSRIQNRGAGQDCEDTILDLIGYLILKRMWKRIANTEETNLEFWSDYYE